MSTPPQNMGLILPRPCSKVVQVLGMLRNMRRYFPKFHSRINMVAPYLTGIPFIRLVLTLDTGMAREKKADPAREYRKNQPVNQPIAIAKAIAALAADDNNHGKDLSKLRLNLQGKL